MSWLAIGSKLKVFDTKYWLIKNCRHFSYTFDEEIFILQLIARTLHCVKSVHIRGFSGRYFPVFGLNTKRYGASLRIQFECGKKRTRKTPNTDTFHAALVCKRTTKKYIVTSLREQNSFSFSFYQHQVFILQLMQKYLFKIEFQSSNASFISLGQTIKLL